MVVVDVGSARSSTRGALANTVDTIRPPAGSQPTSNSKPDEKKGSFVTVQSRSSRALGACADAASAETAARAETAASAETAAEMRLLRHCAVRSSVCIGLVAPALLVLLLA